MGLFVQIKVCMPEKFPEINRLMQRYPAFIVLIYNQSFFFGFNFEFAHLPNNERLMEWRTFLTR